MGCSVTFNPDQVIIAGVCTIRQDQVTHPHLKLCFTLAIATIGSWIFHRPSEAEGQLCWNYNILCNVQSLPGTGKADVKGTPMMKASA